MNHGPITCESSDDTASFAAALTEQYHLATRGMIEVLRFGAMMIQLEETLSARGQGGNGIKGEGVKGWLQQHAPEVARTTAYRLKAVAEGVQREYLGIVGAKVARQFSLPALVTTPASDLPDAARAKQMELFDYVAGTSQRSWLDRFKPAPRIGGRTYERTGGKGQRHEDTPQQAAIDLWTPLLKGLAHEGLHEKSWVDLPDTGEVSRETLAGILLDLSNQLRAARR